MQILLVEDDPILGDGIRAGLQQEGYAVEWMTDGARAAAAAQDEFDLIVLDLGLPQRSGLDILKELRKRKQAVPVLIVTARDTLDDRVKGLDSGADDYITKPFDLDELFARVRALLRRSKGRARPLLEHGDLVLDPAAHTVTKAGRDIELSPGEYRVLQKLLEEQGRVVSRSRLEDVLYGWSKDIGSNTVEVYVHHLRKKVDNRLIRTVRGIGYIIDKQN